MARYANRTASMKGSEPGGAWAQRAKLGAAFAKELSIMVRLRSPRVVQVIGVVTTDNAYLGLVMEYCAGGSLRAALDDESGAITGALQRIWSSDVALGMKYLYEQGVQHRDLKPLNILLTRDLRAKVADFGLSTCEELRTARTSRTTRNGGKIAGTAAFMAPELLDANTFTEKSDVYSYAVVLWEIHDRGIPWRGLDMMQIMRKVVDKGERPPVPAGMPADLRDLMCRCWADKAADRPTFSEIATLLAPRRG